MNIDEEFDRGPYLFNRETGERVYIRDLQKAGAARKEQERLDHHWMDPDSANSAFEIYVQALRDGTLR